MAGIKFPPGVTFIQPIVHVDSPKVVKKYEDMAEKAEKDASERITSIQYELDEALRANRLLEKQMIEKEADVLRLANLKDTEVVALAEPNSEELKQLRSSVGRLKEELSSAYKTMKILQEKQGETQIVTKVERVIEYRDRERIVEKKNHQSIIWVALATTFLGIIAGYFLPKAKSVAPIQIEMKALPEVKKK